MYRKLAPLYNKVQRYSDAVEAYERVLKGEDDKLKKVELWTKIAGVSKKANHNEKAVSAAKEAYEICR